MKGAALFLCAIVSLCHAPVAAACAADAGLSTVLLTPAPAFPCHWLFRLDGGRDKLNISTTLRDAAGDLLPDCEVVAEFVPLVGSAFACTPIVTATTNTAGVAGFSYSKVGGCGTFEIVVTSGAIVLETLGPYPMTSPDLNGDGVVGVIDLGRWASCLANWCRCADYNCDGIVNIIDLGVWAGGLGNIC